MKRPWILIVVGVLGAACIAILVWWRSSAGTTVVALESPAIDRPVEFRAGGLDFDLRPGRSSSEEVSTRVGEIVRDKAAATIEDDVLAEALGKAMSDRLAVMLDPDIDRWMEQVRRFTEPPPLDDEDPNFHNTFRQRWQHGIDGFRAAPIASSGIEVRHITPDAEPLFDSGVPGLVLRANTGMSSASYPQPPKDQPTLRVAEVLVPVMYRSIESGRHDVPATAAFRFFWNRDTSQWQPYDLILYMDEAVLGKKVPFPYL